jgi:hypothetical protein
VAAFDPLRTLDYSTIIPEVVDPFRTTAVRERFTQVFLLGVLVAATCFGSYLVVRPYVTEGRIVRAEVVRVGMYDTGGAAGGNLPILTVKLADGSNREVTSSWAAVKDCVPGRLIDLLQRGTALQVGRPGCEKSRSS